MIVKQLDEDKVEVVGTVPARCSIRGFKAKIIISGNHVVSGECECGSFPCSHTAKLYLMFMARKRSR
ncbi:hypothetical protein DFR88_02560 [Metallosphaera sedula]|uniref:SWIM-type domain-containing protein n=1 Tax=Metallosphaera prunae TaxID=47304 RepID=A0A4D8SCI1_METPR|nr:hypothetical protein DFR88_02560 [Metallosphaera prunae]